MTSRQKMLWIGGGLAATLLLCALVGGALALGRRLATPAAPPTPDAAQVATWAAATLQALQSPAPGETAPGGPTPPATATPAPAASPTASAPPTPGPTPTPIPSPTPPCLAARFVKDVSVPDGTEFAPGTTFTKTWRLRNVGSCTWTTAFTVFFDQGDHMGGPADVNLPHAVEPGETVDVGVQLRAPDAPGTYKGYWKLRDDRGQAFGIGSNRNTAFWVEIKVVAPTPTTPPPTADMILPYDPANSGTIYENYSDTIGGTVMAGDTAADLQARGYFTFDISSLPADIIRVSISLTCTAVGDPFGDLKGIWLAEVEYALPLRPLHYDLPGTPIVLLDVGVPTGPFDVTHQVLANRDAGDPYFQVRLHPKALDHDAAADYLMCSNASLLVTYRP